MIKEVLVLTMSDKHYVPEEGGYCVAGLDITDNNKWIRLIGNHDHFKITDEEAIYLDGTKCKPLDVIRVEVEQMTPRYRTEINRDDYDDSLFRVQPENYIVMSRFELLGERNIDDVLNLGVVDEPEYVYCNTDTCLSVEEAKNNNQSLVMIKVENLELYPKKRFDDDGYQAHYRARFTYNGREYSNISVTDPEYNAADTNYRGLIFGNTYIVFSIGEKFNDNHFKLIAKIFVVVYTIERNPLNYFHSFEDCQYLAKYNSSRALYIDLVNNGKQECPTCNARIANMDAKSEDEGENDIS